jgi:hypothetical protein
MKLRVPLTFLTGLKRVDNIKARVALAKSRLSNVEWHELRAIFHEHVGNIMEPLSLVAISISQFLTLLKCSILAVLINTKYFLWFM